MTSPHHGSSPVKQEQGDPIDFAMAHTSDIQHDARRLYSQSALATATSSSFNLDQHYHPLRASGNADGTSDLDVMAQLASHYYPTEPRSRSSSAPLAPSAIQTSNTWQFADTNTLANDLHGLSLRPSHEPENEPNDSSAPYPATFLKTICDQLESYFCDENLPSNLLLLKNMNTDGYVKLELLASFREVKKLTTDIHMLKRALELSTKLLLNEDESMVCRKEPLAPEQTYHGRLARTAIAYNLPEDASVASMREVFQTCGEVQYLRLLKKDNATGRNAVLKPPIVAGETYAIVEFADEEMAKHAVLTLSDQYHSQAGMQVVLFDGTNCDKLKQKMFPISRNRVYSAPSVGQRPVHVEQVGEGLEGLREGKVSTGTVYSIRGAGGLITPTRQDHASISFRLIPDEDGNVDIRQGDYVSFTVGKNKKSGRKYASKVKLEFRPPASLTGENGPPPSPMGRRDRGRAATFGSNAPPSPSFRPRSNSGQSSNGSFGPSMGRPRLNLQPQTPTSGGGVMSPQMGNGFRQALGPDGTRGFRSRRLSGMSDGMTTPISDRRRAQSTGSTPMYH